MTFALVCRYIKHYVRIVAIPDLAEKTDVSDYLDNGHTLADLRALVDSTPGWKPDDPGPDPEEDGQASRTGRSGGKGQSDRLVNIATSDELFHDEVGTPFAAVSIDGHREIWPVGSRRYRQLLSRNLYEEEGRVANGSALADAIGVVSGIARFDGLQHRLGNRVVWHEGAIWYDLADELWRAVRISADGWEIVDHPPILFQRFVHQSPQVDPVRGGTVELLECHLSLQDTDGLLLTVYLVTALVPEIPHPIVHPHGEKGSGKTVLSRICRSLIDPSQQEVASFPRKLDDLVQLLSHNYMPVFDNVDHLSAEQSDILCRAVTGEGFSKRALYTDDEDVIYRYRRCPLLNGINVAAQRSDLLDRAILIELQPISPGNRKTEEELFTAFQHDRGLILGAMFDGLSKAMRLLPDVNLDSYSRMADFERWGVAVTRARGLPGEDFLRSYAANRLGITEEAIAADPTGQCIEELMKDRVEWTGQPADLYEQIRAIAARLGVDKAGRFPKAANALSRRIREVNGNLRDVGIMVTMSRSGSRRIDINKDVQNTVQTVQPSADVDDLGDDIRPAF